MTEAMILHGMVYILIGAFAGLMAGMFGIGGGLVVVPSLVFVFHHTQIFPNDLVMYAAVGSSLAAMIITTIASVKAHHKIDHILWPVFHKLWPALMVGALVGSLAASWIPTQWLTTFFAIFLLCVALRMLLKAPPSPSEHFLSSGLIF